MVAKTKTITVQVDERLAAEIEGTTVHNWRTTTLRQLGPTLRPRSGSPPGWSARLSALLRTTLRRTLKRVRRRVEESTAESRGKQGGETRASAGRVPRGDTKTQTKGKQL